MRQWSARLIVVNLMKRSIIALIALSLISTTLQMPFVDAQAASSVRINEFVASNTSGIVDNAGDTSDWIELANTTTVDVDLGGWILRAGGDAHVFPVGTVVPANGYLLLFASDEVARSTPDELHLPFKLSASGETLSLTDASSTLTEPSWLAGFPALPTDVSFGLDANDNGVFFGTPTPGAANTGPTGGGIAAEVTLSVPHGYYTGPITVTLDTATPSATIRYTTDATTPTETNGTALAPGQSLTIDQTTTLRAVAVRPGWVTSEPTTASYLFAADVITQPGTTPSGFPDDAEREHAYRYGFNSTAVAGNEAELIDSLASIPTFSIVTDPDNLFDVNTGIYENSTMTGSDWERPTSAEFIDPTGTGPGFTIDAGIRLRGFSTRRISNPWHSLQLRFRDDYDGDLDYPLFNYPGAPESFEAIALGSGLGEVDRWNRLTAGDMDAVHTRSDPVHLFINGHYWGVYFTQERVSNQFASDHLGGSEGDYDVIKAVPGASAEARDGSVDAWQSLWPMVSDVDVDDAEFETIKAVVDFESLADFYVLYHFSGMRDSAPVVWGWYSGQSWTGSNNWRVIRDTTGVGEGGKWHFVHHDTESSLCKQHYGGITYELDNTTPWNVDLLPDDPGVFHPGVLHQALLNQDEYRQLFTSRVYHHMVRDGGALTLSGATARWNAISDQVSDLYTIHYARRSDDGDDPIAARAAFDAEIQRRTDCLEPRYGYVRDQLTEDGLWPTGDAPEIIPTSPAIAYGDAATVTTSAPGTLYVTLDGSDPRQSDGSVNPTATAVTGPISITKTTTLTARTLDNGTWSPLVSQSYDVTPPAGPRPLVLNEWNAVEESSVLGNGDARLGSVLGNGGNWLEMVVTEDNLDLRNWRIAMTTGGVETASLRFSDDALLADLRAGTILTIADRPMAGSDGTIWQEDLSYVPIADDWWIHAIAGQQGSGRLITATAFDVNHLDWQLTIFDDQDIPRFGPVGEGAGAFADGISSSEIGELETDPSNAITADSTYGDGDSSTFGLPNEFAGGVQDLAAIRPDAASLAIMGDVSCDGTLTIQDAVMIAQYQVSIRAGIQTCPINGATEMFVPAADINNSGSVTVADAVIVAQCLSAIDNGFCPD